MCGEPNQALVSIESGTMKGMAHVSTCFPPSSALGSFEKARDVVLAARDVAAAALPKRSVSAQRQPARAQSAGVESGAYDYGECYFGVPSPNGSRFIKYSAARALSSASCASYSTAK